MSDDQLLSEGGNTRYVEGMVIEVHVLRYSIQSLVKRDSSLPSFSRQEA